MTGIEAIDFAKQAIALSRGALTEARKAMPGGSYIGNDETWRQEWEAATLKDIESRKQQRLKSGERLRKRLGEAGII